MNVHTTALSPGVGTVMFGSPAGAAVADLIDGSMALEINALREVPKGDELPQPQLRSPLAL